MACKPPPIERLPSGGYFAAAIASFASSTVLTIGTTTPHAPASRTRLMFSCVPRGTRARGTQPASAIAPNRLAACSMPIGECSMSTVNHGKPTRARTRVAYMLPSDSQVPTCGFPAFRAALTGLRFMVSLAKNDGTTSQISRQSHVSPSRERSASMAEFQTVARVGEIPEGEGRCFEIDGRMIAVFCVAGGYSAIYDTCPHMGASLAAGYVEDGGVMCPWHAWRFCVKSGTWLDNPKSTLRQEVFETRVAGDEIQVEV